MRDYKRSAHAVWECKYHVVWCPKYRFRILKGKVARSARDIIKQLCEWKQVEILEGKVLLGVVVDSYFDEKNKRFRDEEGKGEIQTGRLPV